MSLVSMASHDQRTTDGRGEEIWIVTTGPVDVVSYPVACHVETYVCKRQDDRSA